MAIFLDLENRPNYIEIGSFRDFKALQNRTDAAIPTAARKNQKIRVF